MSGTALYDTVILSTGGTPNDTGDYLDVFAYDLNSNRVTQTHTDNEITSISQDRYATIVTAVTLDHGPTWPRRVCHRAQ